MSMSDERLAELERLADAAGGPWRAVRVGPVPEPGGPDCRVWEVVDDTDDHRDQFDQFEDPPEARARFVVAARTALPALIRRVRDLEAALAAERDKSKPDAKAGLAAIIGKWPGDETDEQIAAALKQVDRP